MTKLSDLKTPAFEVAIDIARTIGEYRYTSGGDSRDDWRDMCGWADEFQSSFESNPDAGETYIEDIEKFAIAKAVASGWAVCEPMNVAVQGPAVDGEQNNALQLLRTAVATTIRSWEAGVNLEKALLGCHMAETGERSEKVSLEIENLAVFIGDAENVDGFVDLAVLEGVVERLGVATEDAAEPHGSSERARA